MPEVPVGLQSTFMIATYESALAYLHSFINNEHRRIEQYAPENYSLQRPITLLANLGNPHLAFPSIHIAGTKGKGSVAVMCASILSQSGLRVGLYTSPHLFDFRERIRILSEEDQDGRISGVQVANLTERLRLAAESIYSLTWFELVTALAFMHFAEEQIDIAVVEVGLGGRLDATNALSPLVSVITSLSLDHTQLLGNTLKEIAFEKGGIIKYRVPVVSAPQEAEALLELERISNSRKAPLTLVGRDWDFEVVSTAVPNFQNNRFVQSQEFTITKVPENCFIPNHTSFSVSLVGYYQFENALAALAAINIIYPRFPNLTTDMVRRALATVEWPGRLQLLSTGWDRPTVLVDGAHNVDSARKLALALETNYSFRKIYLILGVTADKDIAGILNALLPLADHVVVTESSHPRACPTDELLTLAEQLGFHVQTSPSVVQAVEACWNLASTHDLICITGSIFVVGDLLNHWESLQSGLIKQTTHYPISSDG